MADEQPVRSFKGALTGALNAGIPVGIGLGLIVSVLYVALEPNLWPALPLTFLRIALCLLPAFALAAAGIAGIVLLLAARGVRTRYALGALLPAVGVLLAILFFNLPVRFYVPGIRGLVLSLRELAFPAAFFLLFLALALPLARWAEALPARCRAGGDRKPSHLPAIVSLALLLGSAASFRALNDAPRVAVEDTPRVVLIGIDGGDWNSILPLVEEGKLPHLAALIEAGATGDLNTFRPTLSPIVWTSIGSGQPPKRHGITSFLVPGSKVPFTSNMRRVPALWNLLSDAGVSVGIVGWWVTWPAEAVNGHLVSAYSTAEQKIWKGTLHADLEDQTHPPELIDEIKPLIDPAVEAAAADFESHLARFPRPPKDRRFQSKEYYGRWAFSSDRIFADVAAHVAERYAPRFLAFYLAAPDVVGHKFCIDNRWHDEQCPPMVNGAYVTVDRLIGQVLARVGPETTVILVSDHGFIPRVGHGHAPPGILLMKGPGIRRGARIQGATVYDVVPTILSLYGQPVAEDLPGRALLSAFEPRSPVHDRIAFVDAYPPREATEAIPAETDDALRERLRSLGYID